MAEQIPFDPTSTNYDLVTVIDDVPYRFRVRWNSSDNGGAWYFDVHAIDGRVIALGIKVVLGAYLGRTVHHTLFRDGVIVAVDTSGQRLEAGINDLGQRVQVRRYSVEEIFGANARESIR